MKKSMLTLILLALPVLALAQGGPGGCATPMFCGPGAHAGHGGHGQGRHAGEMVEAFRAYQLTEYLSLSEEQTAEIYPKLAAMNEEREEHRELIREKMEELGELLEGKEPDTAKAARLARDIHQLRGEHQDRMFAAQENIMDLLGDEQQARYVMFRAHFQKHLNSVRDRVRGRVGHRGSGGLRDGQGPHGRSGP